MALTVTCKRQPTESGSSDKNQQRTYRSKYTIQQTDTGARVSAPSLIIAAQALMSGDILPEYGDNYADAGTTDLDSYATTFNWDMSAGADQQKILTVDVGFSPAEGTNPSNLAEPDPLLWETEYWVEWTEEQIVLNEAVNVEALPSIGRAANTLGKVVNGAGVEFTEPLMKTVYYPVLHAQKQYATLDEIVALNTTYQGTTNSDTFFGATARKAKYLGTESGRIQKINGQEFYVGITRIWFKNATWDRKVLNNGWSHVVFDGGVPVENADGKVILEKNKVHDDAQDVIDDDTIDPDTPCSEPLNLALDGTLLFPNDAPVYITYRDLTAVAYSGIGIGG